MSGNRDGDGSAEPVAVTEDEIAQLASRAPTRSAAVARLRAATPAAPIGRLSSDHEAPAPLTRSQLSALRRPGRLSQRAIDGLTESDVPANEFAKSKEQRLVAPTKRPPRPTTPRQATR